MYRCISKSSEHSSWIFGLWESDFNSFKLCTWSPFCFFGKYFNAFWSKPSDILSTTCMSSISFFSSVVIVLLPLGWISFDDINVYFEKFGTAMPEANNSQGYIFTICHSSHWLYACITLTFSPNRSRNMKARLRRYRNWHGAFFLMLSFHQKQFIFLR